MLDSSSRITRWIRVFSIIIGVGIWATLATALATEQIPPSQSTPSAVETSGATTGSAPATSAEPAVAGAACNTHIQAMQRVLEEAHPDSNTNVLVKSEVTAIDPTLDPESLNFAKQFALKLAGMDTSNVNNRQTIRGIVAKTSQAVFSYSTDRASTLLDKTVDALQKSDEGRELVEALMDLDAQMQDRETPEKWGDQSKIHRNLQSVRRVPMVGRFIYPTVKSYKEKFTPTGKSIIDGIMTTINKKIEEQEANIDVFLSEAEKLAQDLTEAEHQRKTLEAMDVMIRQQIDKLPSTSPQRLFLEQEVRVVLLKDIAGLEKIIAALTKAQAGNLHLVEAGRLVVSTARQEATQAGIFLQTGFSLAIGMEGQRNMMKAAQHLSGTSARMSEAIDRQLNNHMDQVEQFSANVGAGLEPLKASYDAYKAIHDRRVEYQKTLLSTIESVLPQIQEVRVKMGQMLEAQRKALDIDLSQPSLDDKNRGRKRLPAN